MCQSYQEYHSCLFNHMGDYDSLCAVLTTKTPAPFEGRRISVWEPQGYLRLLLFEVLAYQHRVSSTPELAADKRSMLVDVAFVVRSQEGAFVGSAFAHCCFVSGRISSIDTMSENV